MDASKIIARLYQGSYPSPEDVVRKRINVVVFCARGAQPDRAWLRAAPGVIAIDAGINDDPWVPLNAVDQRKVIGASTHAAARWKRGARVLVTCQAGLNRSGLVTALTLRHLGIDPKVAVILIRSRREGALFNKLFVHYIYDLPQRVLVDAARMPVMAEA